jgi:hypothetical protein
MLQVLPATRREIVKDAHLGALGQETIDDMRAYESRTTGDKGSHLRTFLAAFSGIRPLVRGSFAQRPPHRRLGENSRFMEPHASDN